MSRQIRHWTGLRHEFRSRADRRHRQRPRGRPRAVWNYAHGDHGVILSRDPQSRPPASRRLSHRRGDHHQESRRRRRQSTSRGFKPEQVVGLGVDTTGSTPLPWTRSGQPLAFDQRFAKNPAAMAWLWKDHTGMAEAAEITALARKIRPQYLAKCGGTYSSEWFFSKILHCLRVSPEVFKAAHSWVELADWVPAVLTGTRSAGSTDRRHLRRRPQGHV